MRVLLTYFLFVPIILFAQKPTNLILEGGGIRGIAYAGALEVLDSLHQLDSIENIAATSSGAMNGLLYAIGYSPLEIENIIAETPIQNFNQVGVPLIGGMSRMKKRYGYYSTQRINDMFEKLIVARGLEKDLTFEQLHELRSTNPRFKDLYITGTSLNHQKAIVFSHQTFPNMRVVDAMRISMTIPLYFEAIFINEQGKVIPRDSCNNCHIMVDGGILSNYPFHVFDEEIIDSLGNKSYLANPKTLGLKLENEAQMENKSDSLSYFPINHYIDFTAAFYNVGFQSINQQYLTKHHFDQTITISNLDMNPKVRKLKKSEKDALINSGKRGVRNYFNLSP